MHLPMVLSSDYPSCPEVLGAVGDTIAARHEVPKAHSSVHRSVERSVVFGICIAGCLIDGQRERTFLLRMLERGQLESGGNVEELDWLMRLSGSTTAKSVSASFALFPLPPPNPPTHSLTQEVHAP